MKLSTRNLFRKMAVITAMFLVVGFFAFTPGRAMADITYNYVGNTYTQIDNPTFGDHMTATVTFTDDVKNYTGLIDAYNHADYIISWGLASGSVTLSPASNYAKCSENFHFLNGKIVEWNLYLQDWNPGSVTLGFDLYTDNITGGYHMDRIYDQLGVEINVEYGNPGTWTSNAPVPLPAAFWLLGSGLVGLVGMRKRIASKLG